MNCDSDKCNSDCDFSRQDNSKQLKFGIDQILSDRTSPQRTKQENVTYCDGSVHCCQFSHVIYPQYMPPLYITNSFLPVVRKYTNFVIEGDTTTTNGTTSKRKRIWSRAVFSKLQRKGLEKRFQIQKYIMKPDRKQLAATLGLTDAQVKVWFQNRRMKWRNSGENTRTETD